MVVTIAVLLIIRENVFRVYRLKIVSPTVFWLQTDSGGTPSKCQRDLYDADQ